ncbi:accessory Sec-dependent serine-rich glycoprotein adhesin [Streptococcus porcinus]|uniref:accessory Sec-dependent serine-rich glycoprotein adhesin n=1 Tax=Streptococcus porcinus TaxID=1340 RepID=UPI000B8A6A56|nr:accessory Sec-dependent serine-rich glycoprotein adhesin [Streptococcus porcinus]
MLQKLNKSSFIETESKSRVKLHKSGKSWVKTTLASFGLIQLFKGGQAEERVSEGDVDFVVSKNQLLKGALGVGAVLGGTSIVNTAFAAETTSLLPVSSETGLVSAATDSTVVVASTTASNTTTLDQSSASQSLSSSVSMSQSLSNSQAQSTSEQESLSLSQTTSQSLASQGTSTTNVTPTVSDSTTVSASTSVSASATIANSLAPKASMLSNRTTLAATGRLNNDLVTVTSSYLKDEVSNDGVVYPLRGETIEFYSKFTVDNAATAGDQFTMTYSPYATPSDFDMAHWAPIDITDNSGEVIATGVYDAATKTVTYTFTTYVDKYQNVVASLDAYSYIDRSKVPNGTTLTMSYSMGGETTSKVETVKYESPYVYGTSSIESVINELDTTTHTVEQIFYVNPLQKNAYSTIFSVFGYIVDPNTGAIRQQGSNVINSSTVIEVYNAGSRTNLPDSMNITDYSKFTKVSPTITYGSDTANVYLGDISNVYVVRVVASYDPNSTYDIVQSGTMSSYDAIRNYSIVESDNNIVVNSDVSGGTGTVVTYSAGDYVWFDANKDGLQTSGEKPAANVLVTLTYSDGTTKSVYTDATGHYQFDGLFDKESYTISFTAPAGYVLTSSNIGTNDTIDSDGASITFTINAANNMTIDAGLIPDPVSESASTSLVNSVSNSTSVSTSTSLSDSVRNSTSVSASTSLSDSVSNSTSESLSTSVSQSSSNTGSEVDKVHTIGDTVWEDTNHNGTQDPGEPGISGVTVTLTNPNGSTQTTTTDSNGHYEFTELTDGDYTVTFETPKGYTPTTANTGDDTKDSDGQFVQVTVAGNDNPTIDSGFVKETHTIGDTVWEDTNHNGTQDPGEPGISGVTVTLTNPNGSTQTTTTDSNGHYEFTELTDGDYTVTFETPKGYTPTTANTGDDTKDSDGQFVQVTVAGNDNPTIDSGFVKEKTPELPQSPNSETTSHLESQSTTTSQSASAAPKSSTTNEVLPHTGTEASTGLYGSAALAILVAMGLVKRNSKEQE